MTLTETKQLISESGAKVAWLKGYVVVVGLLLVSLCVYYFRYIPSRKAEINSRNFRLLADLSDHIKSEILLLPSVLSNSVKSLSSKESQDLNQTLGLINKSLRNLTLQAGPKTAAISQWLRYTNHFDSDSAVLEFDYPWTNNSIQASVSLKRVVQSLANIPDFDDILLLEKTGDVLYQRGGAEFRVTHLNLTNVPTGQSFQTNLTIKPTSIWSVGSAGDLMLFAQPLQFTILPGDAESQGSSCQWLVCGLVSPDHLMSHAMAVPYAWLIASLLLMTFFALAWPFADLLFAPASLPLRPRHLVTHYFCGLSLCALVTLGLLLVAGYRALEKRLDNQMKWVAADMHANFQAELEAIAAQIARFDKQYLTNANDETSILANPALCALPPVTSNGAATYPGFNMIVWIDKNGMQTNKWTKEGRKTENINVGRREYFQNAMAGRVWTKEINTEPWRFFIDPIYSWNTGQNDAVVAHHRGSESVPIVSLDVRFQTFFHPVLPVDLGFCVIDESGKVLFHSDEGRNLRENFIVECNNNPKIRRAIQGRTAEALDAEYLSKSCSLFLSPIQDLPWTLVIFREEQKLQTLLLETSFAVLILYTFALVILFGAVTALVLLTRDRRWLWPDAWRRNRYQILTAVNLLFGAIFLWVLPKSASIQTVLVEALLVPAITLFGNWLILRFSKPLLPESRRPRNPARGDVVWYCAALASLIVAASVVPTGRFFALIFNGETELLVRRGQMHFAKQMDERKHRLRSEYARLGGEPKLVNRFLTDLLTSTPNDCFITNFFETRLQVANVLKVCRPDDKPTESVFQMDSLRPLFDETARESSAYISNGDMAGFWHWDYSNAPAKILTLYREETDQDKKPGCWGMVISSRPWSLKQTDGWRWLGVGLGCLAVAALVAWRLYADFFRLKGKTPAPTPGFYLILGEQGRKPPDGYNVISRENQSGEMKSAGDKRERIWIENFHLDAHDPKASQKKLRFLRRCVSNPVERVVIHSRIHPLNFAFDAQPDSDSAANQRLAWSQILLHFRTCFAGEMRRLLREPKARDFESIWAICSPNEKRVLHEIAQNMLVNPKQPEIKTLIRNGLVTLSPGPCLSNDKFGKWIRESAAAAELPRFKLLPQEDRFASIKGPLIFGLVACALIFFLTQRALWDHTVALVPGFLAGLAAVSSLWKALGEFKSGKTALADDKTAAGSDSSG